MIFALALVAGQTPASETVIVRAERLREAAPLQTSLSGTDLQITGAVRLDEALRVVPGVGLFRRTSSGAANATIQGLSLRPIAPNGAGRALVTLDGVPQNDPFGGWVQWGRYDPLFLEKVDVRRGAEGAGFGPLALTGTLDLTEARGQPSALNVSVGSKNSVHASGRGSRATPGAMFTAMATYDASDGAFAVSPSQRGTVDQPIDYQSVSLALVTDIARGNGAWSFRGAGFSEAKGAGLINGQSSAQGLDISVARRFETDLGESRFLIYAQGRDFTNQTVGVTTGRIRSIPALDQFATPSSALGGSFAFAPQSGRNLPNVTVDWRSAVGETRELFRFIGDDFTRARIAGGRQDLIGLGFSLPKPYALKALGLRLDGGVRLDYWANSGGLRVESDRGSGNVILNERVRDNDGTVATGRFSFAQLNGPLRASLYRTFRPATLNELHRPFRIGNDVTEANASLMPETLLGFDVDFNSKHLMQNGTLATSVTLYFNRLDDPIANVTIANGPGVFPRVGFLPAGGSLRERQNVGRVDATGIEGSLSWDAGVSAPSWSLAASVTDARVDGGAVLPQLTSKRPAQAPSWSATAQLNWPVSEKLTWGVTVRGESDRFEDDLNSRKLAAYGAIDSRLSWRISPRTEVYVSGENVLNTRIATARAGDNIVSLTQRRVVRVGLRLGR